MLFHTQCGPTAQCSVWAGERKCGHGQRFSASDPTPCCLAFWVLCRLFPISFCSPIWVSLRFKGLALLLEGSSIWMKCLFLAEAEVHSLLAAVQLCSRQILGVLTAVPPGSLACRHLHGLCWHEVCIHCVCTATDLGVPPSACPGSQRWGCVLYVLQHGSVVCISTFCVFCSPETCQTSH